MIYYLIFFILIVLLFISFFLKEKKLKLVYIIVSAFLILFCGSRLLVGFDYDNYELLYYYVQTNYGVFIEPLFYGLIKLEQYLIGDYSSFLLLVAFLTIAIKTKFIYKFSVLPYLSLLIYYSRYFLSFDFGQIRQGLATAIVLYSIMYVLKKDFKRFIILIIIGCLIHASAFLFIIMYFIGNNLYKNIRYILLISFSFIFVFLDIKDFLMRGFSTILPGGLAEKLIFYGETEESLGLNLSMILRILFVLYILFFLKTYLKKDHLFLVLFNTYFVGVIIYLTFNSLPQLGGRGSAYFQQFEMLLLPLMVYYTKNYFIKGLIILFLIYYTYSSVQGILESAQDTIQYHFEPYKSIFL